MISASVRLAFAAVLFAAPLAAQDDVLTPHHVAKLRSVGASVMSPDGNHVAYTLRVPRTAEQKDGSSYTELHVFGIEDGRDRPFITGEVSIRSVDWMPDSRHISFLQKRDGDDHTSLYVIPIDGGEAQRKVQLEASIRSYSLSPDGTEVALVMTAPLDKDVEKQRKNGFNQEVYEEDWRPAQIWIARMDGEGEPRLVETAGSVLSVAWSPVDDRLLTVTSPTPLVDDTYMHRQVSVVDGEDGEVLATIPTEGKLGQVEWSPDGKHVAMISSVDMNDPSAGRLTVASAEGGEVDDLLPHFKGHVSAIAWQNAEAVMYVASQGVWSTFGRVSLETSGEETPILNPDSGPILRGLSLSADGLSAAFVGSTPGHPPELMTMKHEGSDEPVRRTNSNPWLDDMRLAQQEAVSFTARDGLELEGVLIRPLDYVEGKTYPLILYVHGGPEAHDSNGWNTYYSRPGQLAAARGFAVFYINYRGSTGRGVEFSKLGQGDPAGKEFDDVVDAIDHFLLAQGFEPRGKNGYEEINNVKLSQSYDHPSGIYCAVNLRDGPAVRLRVGVNADDWSSEADRIFEELSTALEARWPGSVRKEPMPDGQ